MKSIKHKMKNQRISLWIMRMVFFASGMLICSENRVYSQNYAACAGRDIKIGGKLTSINDGDDLSFWIFCTDEYDVLEALVYEDSDSTNLTAISKAKDLVRKMEKDTSLKIEVEGTFYNRGTKDNGDITMGMIDSKKLVFYYEKDNKKVPVDSIFTDPRPRLFFPKKE